MKKNLVLMALVSIVSLAAQAQERRISAYPLGLPKLKLEALTGYQGNISQVDRGYDQVIHGGEYKLSEYENSVVTNGRLQTGLLIFPNEKNPLGFDAEVQLDIGASGGKDWHLDISPFGRLDVNAIPFLTKDNETSPMFQIGAEGGFDTFKYTESFGEGHVGFGVYNLKKNPPGRGKTTSIADESSIIVKLGMGAKAIDLSRVDQKEDIDSKYFSLGLQSNFKFLENDLNPRSNEITDTHRLGELKVEIKALEGTDENDVTNLKQLMAKLEAMYSIHKYFEIGAELQGTLSDAKMKDLSGDTQDVRAAEVRALGKIGVDLLY